MMPEVGMASCSPLGTCRGCTDSNEMREWLCAMRHTILKSGSVGPAGFLQSATHRTNNCGCG